MAVGFVLDIFRSQLDELRNAYQSIGRFVLSSASAAPRTGPIPRQESGRISDGIMRGRLLARTVIRQARTLNMLKPVSLHRRRVSTTTEYRREKLSPDMAPCLAPVASTLSARDQP